jgi:bifunctional NMN adenylyltransferase/nudix hydrolase
VQLDAVVVIARFDPVHAGHLKLLEQARELAPQVVILIGSAHRPRSARHPWNIAERRARIEAMWTENVPRLAISAISDHLYSEGNWVAEVRDRVASAVDGRPCGGGIGLLAGPQQNARRLRELFPEWAVIEARDVEVIDAFSLRQQTFNADRRSDDAFEAVRAEFAFLRGYWKSWSVAPYPVNFVTVDALVTHRDHVLLIRRRNQPGQGLLALPGGFLDVNERIQDAAIRELQEETGLDIPEAQAVSSLRRQACFDVPDRSLRGRTITHVFHFDLPGDAQPRVEAADDAAQVEWMPVQAALQQQQQFFEDHFDILESFLAGLPVMSPVRAAHHSQ